MITQFHTTWEEPFRDSLYVSLSVLPVGGESLRAELGVELAELLVGPEEEGGVFDALPLHLQDEVIANLLPRITLCYDV